MTASFLPSLLQTILYHREALEDALQLPYKFCYREIFTVTTQNILKSNLFILYIACAVTRKSDVLASRRFHQPETFFRDPASRVAVLKMLVQAFECSKEEPEPLSVKPMVEGRFAEQPFDERRLRITGSADAYQRRELSASYSSHNYHVHALRLQSKMLFRF